MIQNLSERIRERRSALLAGKWAERRAAAGASGGSSGVSSFGTGFWGAVGGSGEKGDSVTNSYGWLAARAMGLKRSHARSSCGGLEVRAGIEGQGRLPFDLIRCCLGCTSR